MVVVAPQSDFVRARTVSAAYNMPHTVRDYAKQDLVVVVVVATIARAKMKAAKERGRRQT